MTVNSPPAAGPAETRCGFVALIGAPNVGKSTLVNALVGSKVTIVSRKVQTTRALIRGIAIEGQSQIILVDTPGIFAPKRRLDRAMVSALSGDGVGDLLRSLAAMVPTGPFLYPEDQMSDAPMRPLEPEITRKK